MKTLAAIFLLVLVSGCAFDKFIDKKGRDCTTNTVLLVRWDSCESTKEPLAIERQEIKLEANVNQIK